MQEDLSKKEEQVENDIQAGNTVAAVKGLSELIVMYTKKKDFQKAETLRDRLYDTDPMALTEIINANQMIEQEKAGTINIDHRKTWTRLYDQLSTENGGILFYSLQEQEIEGGQTIYRQGDRNNRLYFVNQGQLKMIHEKEDEEILIKTLGAGDLFGQDSFYSINVCTTSVVTMTPVDLSYLDRDVVEQWRTEHHVLESQLRQYSLSEDPIEGILETKGLDRRAHKRLKTSTKVSSQVISPETNRPLSRAFSGVLTDISKGGLCFYIHTKNRKTVQALMGHRLLLNVQTPTTEDRDRVKLVGVVQGAQTHPFDKYSIHLEFLSPLKDAQMNLIQQIVV
jgi:CRP-like cAMP-binding protein